MMMFNKQQTDVPTGCSQYMFKGQGIMQKVCLYLALACIPVMLFGKPLYITYMKKRKSPGKSYVSSSALITVKCFKR
jgi:V-type H+-transporting ATPase subunit a